MRDLNHTEDLSHDKPAENPGDTASTHHEKELREGSKGEGDSWFGWKTAKPTTSEEERYKRITRRMFWISLGFLVVLRLLTGGPESQQPTLDDVRRGIREGQITELTVHIFDRAVSGEWVAPNPAFDSRYFYVHYPTSQEEAIVEEIEAAGLTYETKGTTQSFGDIILSLLPLFLVAGLVLLAITKLSPKGMAGATGRKHAPVDRPSQGFESLGGLDEAIEEVAEVVDFLKDPTAFRKAGARPPRGVLLEGPPGTGKTALARAVAAEASVPFFSVSGSDFVEMFVGVGASRIRSLFKQARDASPSIIFIDEIDAIGRRRAGGVGPGSNEETERTLNQLLVEMDGFDNETGVIIMAATNRVDTLDQALLRPGRFDRRVQVPLPDPAGRKKILEVHSAGRALGGDVDFEALASQTTGFSGAQLEALINEAAILVARERGDQITARHLQLALEKVALGPERRSAKISEEDRKVTAYHEAGHAIVAWMLPEADTPRKVTIIPRGHTGGATWIVPSDRAYLSRSKGLAQLAVAMGGRAGEELLLGDDITAGASHDIRSATSLSRRMIGMYGMDPELGPMWYGSGESHYDDPDGGFLSPETTRRIEAKVSEMNTDALKRAREVIAENKEKFEVMVAALLEREHLDTSELEEILGPLPKRH